ncbi:MAG: Smr/MutS family protein [Myxococcota bacterium]
MPLNDDLHRLAAELESVAEGARALPWAATRPWSPRTHLSSENGLPLVDLHDLSVRLALDAVRRTLDAELDTGGCTFMTGRGKHTGGHSRLRAAVEGELLQRQSAGACRVRPVGPARFEVVLSEDRVRTARPGMGLLFWLFVALLGLAVFATLKRCGA